MTRNNNLSWGVSPPKPPTLGKKKRGSGHRDTRLLRLAVVKNFYQWGEYARETAQQLLDGPLIPDRSDTIYCDSALLDDPNGFAKIRAEYESGT